ncbi:MAG TPA: nitroreductase family protein [Ignavibacteria bacterium]|nr:nitroreductase family protein [Ignavibacteria bacterium]HMR39354.1 nitroreductase family protein [Ignavibacteria bacterium]
MEYNFIRYKHKKLSESESLKKAKEFYEVMKQRRSIRSFSNRKFDIALLETAIKTAGTAPSGANKQPWRFIIVESAEVKKEIRIAAEKEEKESYERRMPQSWLDDLAPLGTDWHKEFLETAPFLIVVFKIDFIKTDTELKKHYYVNESVGLATGILLAALQNMGLATLTHTPSPMNFLQKILNRPSNEKPYLLIPVGYPAEDAVVPDITKKELPEIMLKV